MKNKHKNQYYLGIGVRDNTITNVYKGHDARAPVSTILH